tara:strand:- start:874 stop:1038 length:165 start_codon:yes stop_codon:yes gene_type:complete
LALQIASPSSMIKFRQPDEFMSTKAPSSVYVFSKRRPQQFGEQVLVLESFSLKL